MGETKTRHLERHFGLLHATALNVTMVVGAGVFITIPPMLKELPGPYALLGWLCAGVLMIFDGLVWSELGAMFPGSGGTYLYLLESFGRQRWGRLMAFLFIWQFMLSGPLEIGTGLIAIAQFSTALSPEFTAFDSAWTYRATLGLPDLAVTLSPSRLLALLVGVLIIILLYRRITVLGRLTLTFWVGVLGVIAWILIDGFLHFDWQRAFDFSGAASSPPEDLIPRLGSAMRLAMYSYLGYYSICYMGDEVRDPGRTIPRAIVLSSIVICVTFLGMHLAMLGTVSWVDLDTQSLAADFMRRLHGEWAVKIVTLLLIWSCIGSAFAGLLGYSRIPYGAARYGHFFSVVGRVHPRHAIPHVSLLAVGGLTLLWSLLDLQTVIDALIATRIIEQFVCQIVGVMMLRRTQPQRTRPYRIWLYPLPCLLALVGWLFMYLSAPLLFITLGLGMLCAGLVVFLYWTRRTREWPFSEPQA